VPTGFGPCLTLSYPPFHVGDAPVGLRVNGVLPFNGDFLFSRTTMLSRNITVAGYYFVYSAHVKSCEHDSSPEGAGK
jgi:hypothetical protein